jgi:hypothetical protein
MIRTPPAPGKAKKLPLCRGGVAGAVPANVGGARIPTQLRILCAFSSGAAVATRWS